MSKGHPHRTETIRDQEAELAVLHGAPDVLTAYFREVPDPHVHVIQALYWCLLGKGDASQTLRFKRRNGRPSKVQSSNPPGSEEAAIESFTIGDTLALAPYLTRVSISDKVCELLADAFDGHGKSAYRLAFQRSRVGRPDTPLRTELKTVYLGHTAQEWKKQLGTWDSADQELEKRGLVGADDTSRKRAVRFVKRSREKPRE